MDQYFDVTRGRAQAREQEIRDDFVAYAEETPSTWILEDQMED